LQLMELFTSPQRKIQLEKGILMSWPEDWQEWETILLGSSLSSLQGSLLEAICQFEAFSTLPWWSWGSKGNSDRMTLVGWSRTCILLGCHHLVLAKPPEQLFWSETQLLSTSLYSNSLALLLRIRISRTQFRRIFLLSSKQDLKPPSKSTKMSILFGCRLSKIRNTQCISSDMKISVRTVKKAWLMHSVSTWGKKIWKEPTLRRESKTS